MGRSQEFNPNLTSVPQARALVTDALRPDVDTAVADVAALLTTELSANAVVHAGTPFTVTATRDDQGLTVAVHDHNPSVPQLRHPGPHSLDGRGMHIVDELASDWGITTFDGDGKAVWFRLDSGAF